MIKSAISLKAHAKINLHLEVLGKRSDGFHDIVSVFAPISLADELLMQRKPDKKECKVLSPLAELPAENTITRAYEEFKNFAGISEGVSVRILKRIPEGAGLGGGSSDAASVLRGLNDMFSTGLTEEDLRVIALKIGSDVPFFFGKWSCGCKRPRRNDKKGFSFFRLFWDFDLSRNKKRNTQGLQPFRP